MVSIPFFELSPARVLKPEYSSEHAQLLISNIYNINIQSKDIRQRSAVAPLSFSAAGDLQGMYVISGFYRDFHLASCKKCDNSLASTV